MAENNRVTAGSTNESTKTQQAESGIGDFPEERAVDWNQVADWIGQQGSRVGRYLELSIPYSPKALEANLGFIRGEAEDNPFFLVTGPVFSESRERWGRFFDRAGESVADRLDYVREGDKPGSGGTDV